MPTVEGYADGCKKFGISVREIRQGSDFGMLWYEKYAKKINPVIKIVESRNTKMMDLDFN